MGVESKTRRSTDAATRLASSAASSASLQLQVHTGLGTLKCSAVEALGVVLFKRPVEAPVVVEKPVVVANLSEQFTLQVTVGE
jgi:hypothetical protein